MKNIIIITNPYNSSIQKKTLGRNIGDFFWTYRLDTILNGAYSCNGAIFYKKDFKYNSVNPYNLLIAGMLPAVSFSEYAQELTSNNENCGFWGLDLENESFKIPTLEKICIEAMSGTSAIGSYSQDQIVNHIHTAPCAFNSRVQLGNDNGVSYGSVGAGANTSAVINAKTGDRVKPRTITLRAMVQLED